MIRHVDASLIRGQRYRVVHVQANPTEEQETMAPETSHLEHPVATRRNPGAQNGKNTEEQASQDQVDVA